MKFGRMLVLFTGLFFLVLGAYLWFFPMEVEGDFGLSADVVEIQASATNTVTPTVSKTPTLSPTQTSTILPTATITAIPTKTPEPVYVHEYNLADKVNLSSGMLVFNIRLDETHLLRGSWAETISYREDLPSDANAPYQGVIEAFVGDTTMVLAHSGTWNGKPVLFGSALDLYLRKNKGVYFNLATGKEMVADLVGKTAFLCGTELDEDKKFTEYDATKPCPDIQLELKIVSAALLPQSKYGDYVDNFLTLRRYLVENDPESGFDHLNPKTGFVYVTCLGKYPDQPAVANVPAYDYNKVILGLEVVP